jgi:hypothetical protein
MMRTLGVGLVLVALVGATACGAAKPKSFQTAAGVAALLRDKWGSTTGSPSFDYSCTRIDEHGQLFTCLARDRTDTVRLASFDVVCEDARCSWTVYPAYVG